MTRYVIDTSVAIKWFLPLKAEEDNVNEALQILSRVLVGDIECYQPPHFITEILGVLTRLRPEKATENLTDLLNMDFHRVETSQSYTTACSLSVELNHHTFDTLYHAVALEIPGATFITADDKYYRKAPSHPPVKASLSAASCDFLIRSGDGGYIEMASAY